MLRVIALVLNLCLLGVVVLAVVRGSALPAVVFLIAAAVNLFALKAGQLQGGSRFIIIMLNLLSLVGGMLGVMVALAYLLTDPDPEATPLPEGVTLAEHVATMRRAAGWNLAQAAGLLLAAGSTIAEMLTQQWRADRAAIAAAASGEATTPTDDQASASPSEPRDA